MSSNRHIENSPEHQEIAALIPWFVNASLEENDRQRVEAHTASCALCRDDLVVQQRIFEAIEREPTIEYMPAASLKRLQARLDAVHNALPVTAVTSAQPAATQLRWRGLMAASIAVMAVAVTLLLADRWVELRANLAAPRYRTVTSSVPRPRDEVIRAVFSPTITLVQLQAVLDEAGLKIISGPTEAGVYSLAATSTQPVRQSLSALRQHSAVRFAEATQPESGAGASP
jgi:hypothetical protein